MKEMCNQILGSMTAEFAGEDVNLSGTVSEIELTDMEIQQNFLIDSKMQELTFTVIGKTFSCFLVFDDQAIASINASFEVDDTPAYQPDKPSFKDSIQQEPVRVSRAQFSEIEEVRPSSGKNINIDVLMDVVLPVTVELVERHENQRDIEIAVGSVVELDKLAGDLVDLMTTQKFAVVRYGDDENYAVRYQSCIKEERIKSLGQD